MAQYLVQRLFLPASRVVLGAAVVLAAGILWQPTVVSADTTYAVYDPDPRYRVRLDTSVGPGPVENSIKITARAALQFNAGGGFFDVGPPSTPSTYGITGDTYVYQEIPAGGVVGSTGVDGGSVTKYSAAPGLRYTFRTNWRGVFSGTTFTTSNLDEFTLANPPPSTPSGLAVSPDPSTEGATLTFSWNAVSGADSYTVETDSGPCASGGCSVAGASITRSGYAVGSHWVQVKACRTGASPPCSSFSPQKSFTVTVLVGLPVPTNLRVTPNPQRHGDTGTISWDSVAGATYYKMFNTWGQCGGVCDRAAEPGSSQTIVSPNTNISPGDHAVWVRACDAACGNSTNPVNFTIQSNDAAFVSQSVPASVQPNQPFPVTLVFRNSGTATWDESGGYLLRSQNPAGNSTWGTAQVALSAANPTSVSGGQQVTFSGNLVAPSAPGTYNFQWGMYRSTNSYGYFGRASENVSITVSGPVSAEPIRVQLQIKARQHLPLQ